MTYDPERVPILGENSTQPQSSNARRSRLWYLIHFFGGGIYAPDASTFDPIEILLNEQDETEQDRLTEKWRDNRLSELSFVGVVAALLAGVLTSTGSWPDIFPDGQQKPWPIRTSWYCGIILALFSILTAADQTVRLHRMSSHRDALRRIRALLAKSGGKGKTSKKTGRTQPNTAQIYTWQLPVIFLTTATICMVIGMFLHVWSAATRTDGWDSNSKMALTFTIVAIVSIALFFAGQVTLYSPDDDKH